MNNTDDEKLAMFRAYRDKLTREKLDEATRIPPTVAAVVTMGVLFAAAVLIVVLVRGCAPERASLSLPHNSSTARGSSATPMAPSLAPCGFEFASGPGALARARITGSVTPRVHTAPGWMQYDAVTQLVECRSSISAVAGSSPVCISIFPVRSEAINAARARVASVLAYTARNAPTTDGGLISARCESGTEGTKAGFLGQSQQHQNRAGSSFAPAVAIKVVPRYAALPPRRDLPAHSIVTDDLLSRMERAESGGKPGAVGDHGRARGSFQFWAVAWRHTSRVRAARGEPTFPYCSGASNRAIARSYAESYLRHLETYHTATRGHAPTQADLLVLWNRGPRAFQRRGFFPQATRNLIERVELAAN